MRDGEEESSLASRILVCGADEDTVTLVDGISSAVPDYAGRIITSDAASTQAFVSAASISDIVILIVDPDEGLTHEARRNCYLASLLGVRHAVLLVDADDLAGLSHETYEEVSGEFFASCEKLHFETAVCIPASLMHGQNLRERSAAANWHDGPSLLEHLSSCGTREDLDAQPLRVSVEKAETAESDSVSVRGSVVSGILRAGDEVAIASQGRKTRVVEITSDNGATEMAAAGQRVGIVLEGGTEISPGEILASPQSRPEVADQFAAHLLWFSEDELLPHREYVIKIGGQTVSAHVTQLKHKVDDVDLEHLAARTLHSSEVGYCNFSTSRPIVFDPYAEIKGTGGFTVLDRATSEIVGVGMIEFGLRRATNVHWQALEINTDARSDLKQQRPCILWFTGLSGSGKSTIANLVEKRLYAMGRHTYILDGDNVRHGLNKDLGFTDADRVENIRRVAEAAKLFVDAGIIVLVSFISPFRSERQLARDLMKTGEFIEIFVDTPLETCVARDPKGLYRRAQAGQIKNFTGIDSPYEAPENPDIVLKTEDAGADDLAERVVTFLREQHRLL